MKKSKMSVLNALQRCRKEDSKMDQELVTIVVPIYNVEQYLNRCINSIVDQSYRNLEILLIDDGSPDNCPKMCDEWMQKDNRIRVVHKINAGLGMARNTGIEHARGKYICFFDSDDYIAPDTIKIAYKSMAENQADIVVFGSAMVDESQMVLSTKIPEANVYQDGEVLQTFLPTLMGENPDTGFDANIPFSAWSCLFSMELIQRAQWRFVSEREIVSEDIYSLMQLYRYVRKVVVLKECLYFYCRNGASLTQSYRSDRYNRNRHFYLKCLELCESNGYSYKIVSRCKEPFLSNVIGVLKQEVAHHKSVSDSVNRLKEIVDDDVLQQVAWAKKNERTNVKKALLYWSIRHKFCWLCYAFLRAKNATSDK